MASTLTSTVQTASTSNVGLMNVSDLNASLRIVQQQSTTDTRLVDVCVSVTSPMREVNTRGPANVCCVIDVSGSMTTSASVSGAEDAGLSVLDIVKHAVNTITKSLSSEDRLSVVTFSDNARVLFANVQMDDAGKKKATTTVNALCTEGCTNLWAGLLQGMDILHTANNDALKSNQCQRNSSLFLLTDGVPNVNPAEGYISAMQRFRDENGGFYPGTIHTFGFGYSLKSALLHEIAMEGNGTYNFIPDSGFVGTAFVNTLANQLTSYGTQCTLSLQLLSEGASLIAGSLPPNGSHIATSWGVNINVGNLLFDQQRDFVVQLLLPECSGLMSAHEVSTSPLIEATLAYSPMFVRPRSAEVRLTQTDIDTSVHGALNLDAHMFRCSLVNGLAMGYEIDAAACVREVMLMTGMQAWHASTTAQSDGSDGTVALLAFVGGLIEDLGGQVRMAHTQEAHRKWGTHYIPSLMCAHQRQQCNNFKDPGVQSYGGALFREIRDKAEEVFLSIPPPQPSRNTSSNSFFSTGRGGGGGHVDMSAYHNSSAGCFAGCGQVTLADGHSKLIQDIVTGDRVVCDAAAATTAVVQCVVRTRCSASQTAEFVKLSNGLLLTPWHPVWQEGRWQFPMEVTGGVSTVQKAEYVYNFVLGEVSVTAIAAATARSSDADAAAEENQGRGQSMVVNGVQCITLAHGIESDAVATHEFYGTGRVLDALRQYAGYTEGLVVMDESHVQRCDDTGLVSGFSQVEQV